MNCLLIFCGSRRNLGNHYSLARLCPRHGKKTLQDVHQFKYCYNGIFQTSGISVPNKLTTTKIFFPAHISGYVGGHCHLFPSLVELLPCSTKGQWSLWTKIFLSVANPLNSRRIYFGQQGDVSRSWVTCIPNSFGFLKGNYRW